MDFYLCGWRWREPSERQAEASLIRYLAEQVFVYFFWIQLQRLLFRVDRVWTFHQAINSRLRRPWCLVSTVGSNTINVFMTAGFSPAAASYNLVYLKHTETFNVTLSGETQLVLVLNFNIMRTQSLALCSPQRLHENGNTPTNTTWRPTGCTTEHTQIILC